MKVQIWTGSELHETDVSNKDEAKKVYEQLKSLIKWEPKEFEEYPEEIRRTIVEMNDRNALIALWKHEKGYGNGGWEPRYSRRQEMWIASFLEINANPENTFETREQAHECIEALGLNDE